MFAKSHLKTWLFWLLFICPLLSLPRLAGATNYMSIFVENGGLSPGDAYYAVLSPSFEDLSYTTLVVSSADGRYALTDQPGGGTEKWPDITSFSDLVASLQQPWRISLDAGLTTERDYTMSLALGELATGQYPPPSITFPQFGSTIDSLTPIFTVNTAFTLTARLSHFVWVTNPDGSRGQQGIDDYDFSLTPDSPSWTPPAPLLPGMEYELDVDTSEIYPTAFAFSDPLDASGNAIPNWFSRGAVLMNAVAQFETPVPEASCGVYIAVVFAIALRRVRRGTRDAASIAEA
ncbi:MAG TPA: hypothetical protein VK797_04235 [Tepidisphaeraceae bacterium]|jgi:hypothetical protein|nr:hypothetical protein [Tepidisphaeraceae bacterium]